jgi:hypothetical protein
MLGRSKKALLAPAVLLGVVACTATSAARTSSPPPTPTATAPATALPAPADPVVVLPKLPESQPGLRTLALVPLRRGSEDVAEIKVNAGEVVTTLLCTGGTLNLYLDPAVSNTVQCANGPVSPIHNVFRMATARSLLVRVKVGPDVRWNLRVEQR